MVLAANRTWFAVWKSPSQPSHHHHPAHTTPKTLENLRNRHCHSPKNQSKSHRMFAKIAGSSQCDSFPLPFSRSNHRSQREFSRCPRKQDMNFDVATTLPKADHKKIRKTRVVSRKVLIENTPKHPPSGAHERTHSQCALLKVDCACACASVSCIWQFCSNNKARRATCKFFVAFAQGLKIKWTSEQKEKNRKIKPKLQQTSPRRGNLTILYIYLYHQPPRWPFCHSCRCCCLC